ncbi:MULTISPECIES: DUF4422 domain-containing protein [unclassified Tatumella]|uniref:DUF4422 domain-containing protein n=1 Tax=unclassified Tatumella TaxID=2649542 RepID=UPI001BAF57D2|nr:MULTISPECIES: DUF4422 domain-containing protein [unclassified Tatumella]MBS0854781.1 DUF4422 domain-containing protein [Tatumella sp. JGM16]MBS0913870.1 DUF4422 domain-containing protein [Tatumella sp. JGM91]
MNKIKIYTSHHKPSAFLDASCITPLHVGKANTLNTIGCEGDDRDDNISFKNPFYCELTAQYWAWKNSGDSDYIGFMHYRRHLNFSKIQNFPEDNWGVVVYPEIDRDYQEKFQLTDEGIAESLEGVDILLPRKWSVLNAGSKNNYIHYAKGEYLHIGDYDLALAIVKELYPEFESSIRKFNDDHEGYYTNMFVMKKHIFDEYSEWLFSITDELEKRIAFRNYNAQEKRVIGHISERLFNIFIIHKINENPEIKTKEVQRTFVSKETFNGKIKPVFDNHSVPIVICFDDKYSISGAALINSILKNSRSDKNYDIIILENSISVANKRRIYELTKNALNISLRFFDINAFTELSTVHTRGHFTAATYARLFIPALFELYNKVLFIDADTIVESDVSELIDIDLGNNLVAAVRDIVMEGFLKFGAIADSSCGTMPARKYLISVLGMTHPEQYFQAGIILFNIVQMSAENTYQRLIDEIKDKYYWFLDQDIMNKVFYDRVHYLPLEWNVYHGNGNTDDFYPNLRLSTYLDFLKARMNPKMIHFAGENKPWNTKDVDYFDNFESYLNSTPWSSELTQRLYPRVINNVYNAQEKILFQTKIKRKIMPLVDRYAPTGSAQRNFLIKYYYKFRRKIIG